ncbi:uncharacterized protein LOC135197808 [Macrobrachium nipponense]|uniref:uncharacterized protein LOC135197808 n=1 Tax=Macrobrachium nipponense TaxID=159736 RepID=UPI0030C841EB
MRQSEVKKTRIGQGSTSPLRLQLLTSLISSRGSRNGNNRGSSINLLILVLLPLLILQQSTGAEGQATAAISVAAIGSNGTASAVEITGVCNDLLPNCTQRGTNGECDSDPADMLVNCPSTCGSCLPVSEADCVDKGDPESCFLGAALGECTANPSYYLRFCSASCSEYLPICSLQTRDFGEICQEQSRSLTNPDFDCGTDFEESAQREARSAPDLVIPGNNRKKTTVERIGDILQKAERRRNSGNLKHQIVNNVRFVTRRNNKHVSSRDTKKKKGKNRKKGKRHKKKRGHRRKGIQIPSFITATDATNLETSINKVTEGVTTQEIQKQMSLKTLSTLVSSLYGDQPSAVNSLKATSAFAREGATSNVPTSTNIIVDTFPTETKTTAVSTNTITITVEGSVGTTSTITSFIPLSSTVLTLSSSFETVTVCTEDFTIPENILSLLSGYGPISTIIYERTSSLVFLSSYVVTATKGREDFILSADLVSSFMMQRGLLSELSPLARNFISPTAVLMPPLSRFLTTPLPRNEVDDIPLAGTRNEIYDIQVTEPEWRKTITSTIIVAHTIYTKCDTPVPDDQQCSINTKDDGSCEIMPSEDGYCSLPCDFDCSMAIIKRDHCNINDNKCPGATIDLDTCGEKCPNLTILIDNCENDILNDCQSLTLGVGNNTNKETACPIPTIDFNNCESTPGINCSVIKVLSSTDERETLSFSEEDCFSIYLDDDNTCGTLITEKVKCIDIVFEQTSCPSVTDNNGDCSVITSKKNSVLSLIPAICENPVTTPAPSSTPPTPETTLSTSETTLTTPETKPTTPDPTSKPTEPPPTTDPPTPTTDSPIPPTDPPPTTSTDSTHPPTEPPTTTSATDPPSTSTTFTSTDPPVTTMPPTTISPDETTQPDELLTPETIAALTIASTVISIVMSQTNISLFQQLLQQLFQAIIQQLLQANQNNQNNSDNNNNNNNNNNNDQNNNNNDNNQDNDTSDNNDSNNNNNDNNNNDNNNNNNNNNANNNNQGNNQGSGQGNGQGSSGSQDAQPASPGGGSAPPSPSSSENAAAALVPNCEADGYLSLVGELESLVGKNTGKPLSPAAFDFVEAVNFCQHGGSAVPSMAEDILIPDAELVPPPQWLGLSSPVNTASRNKRRTIVEQQHIHGYQSAIKPPRSPSLFKPPVIEYGGWIPVTQHPFKQSVQLRKKAVLQDKGKTVYPSKLVRPKRKQGTFNSQSKEIVLIIANGLYTVPPEISSTKDLKSSLFNVSTETLTNDIQPASDTSSSLPSLTEVLQPTLSTTSIFSSTEFLHSQLYVPPVITPETNLTTQTPSLLHSTESSFDLGTESITDVAPFTTVSANTTSLPINVTNDDRPQGLGPAAIGFSPDSAGEEDEETENERREEHLQEEEGIEDEGNDETELTRNIFYCGGTLISQKHILTAAHCVIPRKPNVIRLGERDFSTSNESRTVDYRVKRIAVNPGYRFPIKYNDIAVITLEDDIPLNSGLVPSCVPTSELELFEGLVATVSGWGTRANNEASDILIDVEVRVRSLLQCNESYNTLGEVFTLHYPDGLISNMLCAGGDEGEDVCRGDSGGPLFLQELLQVAGVVSAGYGCGDVNFPGLYTRVDSFLAWIDLAVYGKCASPIR